MLRMVPRSLIGGCLAVAALCAAAPVASAGTTIGATFTPDFTCDDDFTNLQSASIGATYAVRAPGVITSWSHQAGGGIVPTLKFKVGRPMGSDRFTIVGESPPVVPQPNALSTFPVQIPVQVGDVIGVKPVTPGDCAREPAPGYTVAFASGDLTPGSAPTFGTQPNQQLDVAANLETEPCRGKPPTIAGTPGKDTLVGTSAADVIVGLGGRDKISGLGGGDTICGGDGKDTLVGGAGADKLLGQKGDDKLKGGGGNDRCKGGKGDDTLSSC